MTANNVILLLFGATPLLALAGLAVSYRHYVRRRRSSVALILGNVCLLALLLSMLLVAGEVYYRFVYDGTDGYDLDLVTRRWLDRNYRSNNFGVRDDIDYENRIRPGKRRITVLGDSYSNGHGLADVEQRFVNLLRREHPAWEVHLLGADGMDTGALLERLDRRLADGYRIQDVVYVYCLNDISDLIDEWQTAAGRLYGERLGFFLGNSYLLNTYYYRVRVSRDRDLSRYFEFIAAAYRDERWERHAGRLRTLARRVEENGGELTVVTFPFFEQMASSRYRAIHEQLDAFWSELGIRALDLITIYAALPPDSLIVSRHDTHPNALAHRMASDAIAELLTPDRAEARALSAPPRAGSEPPPPPVRKD